MSLFWETQHILSYHIKAKAVPKQWRMLLL
jgi:hypothetical protein